MALADANAFDSLSIELIFILLALYCTSHLSFYLARTAERRSDERWQYFRDGFSIEFVAPCLTAFAHALFDILEGPRRAIRHSAQRYDLMPLNEGPSRPSVMSVNESAV